MRCIIQIQKEKRKKKSSFCLTFSRTFTLNFYFLGYFWSLNPCYSKYYETKTENERKLVWWNREIGDHLYMKKQINKASKYQLWSENLRGKKAIMKTQVFHSKQRSSLSLLDPQLWQDPSGHSFEEQPWISVSRDSQPFWFPFRAAVSIHWRD